MLHHVSTALLLLLHFPRCFAASSTITAEDGGSTCTKNEVYSSLSREGREFCESVLEDHCATVSTPPAYTLLEDDEISSYCECILTEQHESTRTESSSSSSSTESSDDDGTDYSTAETAAASSMAYPAPSSTDVLPTSSVESSGAGSAGGSSVPATSSGGVSLSPTTSGAAATGDSSVTADSTESSAAESSGSSDAAGSAASTGWNSTTTDTGGSTDSAGGGTTASAGSTSAGSAASGSEPYTSTATTVLGTISADSTVTGSVSSNSTATSTRWTAISTGSAGSGSSTAAANATTTAPAASSDYSSGGVGVPSGTSPTNSTASAGETTAGSGAANSTITSSPAVDSTASDSGSTNSAATGSAASLSTIANSTAPTTGPAISGSESGSSAATGPTAPFPTTGNSTATTSPSGSGSPGRPTTLTISAGPASTTAGSISSASIGSSASLGTSGNATQSTTNGTATSSGTAEADVTSGRTSTTGGASSAPTSVVDPVGTAASDSQSAVSSAASFTSFPPNLTSIVGSALITTSRTGNLSSVTMGGASTWQNQTTTLTSPTNSSTANASVPIITTANTTVVPASTQSSFSSSTTPGVTRTSVSWNSTSFAGPTSTFGQTGTAVSGNSSVPGPTFSQSLGQSTSVNGTGGGFSQIFTSASNATVGISSTTSILPTIPVNESVSGPSALPLPSSSRGPWFTNSTSASGQTMPLTTGPLMTGTSVSSTTTQDEAVSSWNSTDGVGGGFTGSEMINSTTLLFTTTPTTLPTSESTLSSALNGSQWTGPWNLTMTLTAPGSQWSGLVPTGVQNSTSTTPPDSSAGSEAPATTRPWNSTTMSSLSSPGPFSSGAVLSTPWNATQVSSTRPSSQTSAFTSPSPWNSSVASLTGISSQASGLVSSVSFTLTNANQTVTSTGTVISASLPTSFSLPASSNASSSVSAGLESSNSTIPASSGWNTSLPIPTAPATGTGVISILPITSWNPIGSSHVSTLANATGSPSTTISIITWTGSDASATESWISTVQGGSSNGTFTYASSSLQPSPPISGEDSSSTRSTSPVLTTSSSRTVTEPYDFGNSTSFSVPTRTIISATDIFGTTSSPSPSGNITIPSTIPIQAENYTDVALSASLEQDTCYQLPAIDDDGTVINRRRALLRNSKLREANVTVPVPYIESIDFDTDGVQPLFTTVRNAADETYYLDISNSSRLAIVDSIGNSMLLDDGGVYFSTNSCRFDVNVTINDMFSQVADLSDNDCSFGDGEGSDGFWVKQKQKRAEDIQFNQTLYLRDQCGNPVTEAIRVYPELLVGDTRCQNTATDEDVGRWEFDCTFPGTLSGTLQCQRSVSESIVDFLTRDSFAGSCPDLPSMLSILADTSRDIINPASLRTGLDSQQEDEEDVFRIHNVVSQYDRLWQSLQEFFISANNSTIDESPWEKYFSAYNSRRSLINDICEDLHTGEIPLQVSLQAGASYFPAITTLNWAPSTPRVYNVTVQDPSAQACCPGEGGVTENEEDDDGEVRCSYPPDAFIQDTSCICGRAEAGYALAFEATECENFEGTCDIDEDCDGEYVCLTGTCCETGVCVDAFACSQNGTALVKFGETPVYLVK